MLNPDFNILGAFIVFAGVASYIFDTLRGKVKPNRVSWLLWTLAPMIAFFAEIKQGVGLQSLLPFMAGICPLLVVFASFVNKKAAWKIEKFDLLCGGFSIIGLLLWQITRVGDIAILFSIIADGMAGTPTIIKSWKAPETENAFAFLTTAIATIITLLTIKVWTFANSGFTVYLLCICILLTILIKFKIGRILRNKHIL